MSVQNTHKHTKTHTADPLSTTSDDDERFDHFLLHLFAGSWVARELENRQRALRPDCHRWAAESSYIYWRLPPCHDASQ